MDPLVYMMMPMSVGPGVTGCTSALSLTFLPLETTSQNGTIEGSPGNPVLVVAGTPAMTTSGWWSVCWA